jgi:hypothetical protein
LWQQMVVREPCYLFTYISCLFHLKHLQPCIHDVHIGSQYLDELCHAFNAQRQHILLEYESCLIFFALKLTKKNHIPPPSVCSASQHIFDNGATLITGCMCSPSASSKRCQENFQITRCSLVFLSCPSVPIQNSGTVGSVGAFFPILSILLVP